jgi:hypothetical protein
MSLFPSFHHVDEKPKYDDLDKIKTGPLFHTIEYELSSILSKILDENVDEDEIKDIIHRQHEMIFKYDLFLKAKIQLQMRALFTNKRFLRCTLDIIRLLNISWYEKMCINIVAYDYNALPDRDKETGELLYLLTTEVNTKEIILLSVILGEHNSKLLAMVRNSSFDEVTVVRRVNMFVVKCGVDLSIKNTVDIYCYLFNRITNLFVYTMMEQKPNNLTAEESRRFDYISVAMLEMLNSLDSNSIKHVITEYAYTLKLSKRDIIVRFAIKSVVKYVRIISVVRLVEESENIKIP